ncbi:MAG: response regulator [Chitinophagaceae bacterium]|nr:response regulator [Chitinophagaceae bacterium]
MEIAENFFLPGHIPLFVLSTFNAIIFFSVLVAMAFILFGFYRSNANSYHNKITAMAQQIDAMQQHLDYASREETKARADAKRSAAAREKLLTSLSHEIRTPMNGILGMAILLEDTNLNPEQRDYLDTMISSGRILLNKVDEVMANDTLDQSKIDQAITATQHKNTDLRNCVEEVIETFAVKASKKTIELLYKIDEEVPMQVLTDNNRLKQVLTNLVEKAMENKPPQVVIAVHIVKHDSMDVPPTLGFAVGENQVANSAEAAAMLLAGNELPGNNPEEEQDEKSLGLVISKKLVEEMSGQIRMTGEVNSSFIFSIPLNKVPMLAGTAGYSLKDFEGKPVLIVNNNTTAAAILKDQLQQWKLLPVLAENGPGALQLLAERSFSLVITEMNMPGMNGYHLAGCIKDEFPQLPVILLNPLNDDQYREQEDIAKEITVLTKPVKQHTLFDNILSNLRQKKNGQVLDMSAKKLSTDFSKRYPLRILVAEDNLVNQKWAIKILGKLGYEADIAGDGHIVLDMVDKTAYDLILMDVQMPGMDGLEATKMIRVCLNKQPTIIAMTANVMHGDRMACMQAGMDDYISKPVQLGELVNMLEKWAMVITDRKLV